MKILYKLMVITISITMLFLLGCSEEFLDEEALTFFSEENFYKTSEGMEAAHVGLYSVAHSTIDLNGSNRVNFACNMFLGTDLGEPVPFQYKDPWRIIAEYNEGWNAEFRYAHVWQDIYSALKSSNMILANLDRPSWKSDMQKNRIKGNALFFRAYWYFWLVQAYGDVPLVIKPVAEAKTDYLRTPKDEVVGQIIGDLTEAANILPEIGELQGEIGRGAAQHLLTNVYLYQEDWVKAEQTATQLINSGTYRLMTERFGIENDQPGTAWTDLFLDGNINMWEGNEEMIWALQMGDNYMFKGTGHQMRVGWLNQYDKVAGLKRSLDYWQRGKQAWRVSQFYLNLFDPDYRYDVNFYSPATSDDRASEFAIKTIWIFNDAGHIESQKDKGNPLTQVVNGETVEVEVGDTVVINKSNQDYLYPLLTKYMDIFGESISETRSDKDFPLMRLAETYLFRAEARFRQGDLPGAAADINTLRRRANATEISSGDVDIDFILDERARELLGEVSRRFTLMRTGKLIERNRLYNIYGKDNISEKHNLYPIPQVELDRMKDSPNFPQNPGW